ncbi:thymidylate synthase [Thiothrix eikelboomii]|uniref:thymidylate synthase n=1 Tax=Thiothrix eikelboomii TaxID=92487 RepID=UPI003BB1BCE6
MIVIDGDDCLNAWKKGCGAILENNGDLYNLFTTIENPNYLEDSWIFEYDPRRMYKNSASLSDVINTIFPYKMDISQGREDFYNNYLKLHRSKKRIGAKKKKRWGTYFERMICFGSKEINQIEEIISVLLNDKRHLKALNPIHITSCEYDSLKKRLGNPCLQYIQFTFADKDTINATVVYRNHDFLKKALGNFIGLGMLLKFIAHHTNKKVGSLSCLSTHAFTDHKRNLIKLADI